MRLARTLFLAAFLPVVHVLSGCTSESEPTSLTDPGYLPTGTYALTIGDASCSVNPGFRNAERVPLIRIPPTNVSIPVPTDRFESAADFDMPRREIDLAKKRLAFSTIRTSGEVTVTVDATEVTPTTLGLMYRELDAEGNELCAVPYSFRLEQAACPRDCESKGATLIVAPGGAMSWQCECE